MTEVDKYLQEKVLGEKLHEVESWNDGFQRCNTCEEFIEALPHPDNLYKWLRKHHNRDFSTPADYCALEDKMVELGEEINFEEWLHDKCVEQEDGDILVGEWIQFTRVQRAELIAEYYKSKEQ